jgi:hypothetical protein
MSVTDQYLSMLESAESEQTIQSFLEKHTELLPVSFERGHGLWGDFFISKFQLDTSLVTDFSYLTKDSSGWTFVFVELEQPRKRIFTKESRYLPFHSEFNAAVAQIDTWRDFVGERSAEVISRLKPFLWNLHRDPVDFKFVLVYGRDSEFKNSERKRKRFYGQNSETFKVLTYDSLVRWHSENPRDKKNILRHEGAGFTFKELQVAPLGFFDGLDSTWFTLTKPHEELLRKSGYDLDSWKSGGNAINEATPFGSRLRGRSPDTYAQLRARFFGLTQT